MRVVETDQPSVIRPVQGERVAQPMRPVLALFPLCDLELQPVPPCITVNAPVKAQQEFQRVFAAPFCHLLPYPHMITIHTREPGVKTILATFLCQPAHALCTASSCRPDRGSRNP